ncbi:HAMP domain-containing histidine kinase [Azospirillum sp. YIM DDC1]|uniref:Signal transduction histidine-protein kinase/phosphatase MprB n=1 Tax=Azospirillum aestuarii TaxID=2802052 RepID=A0ABS1I4R2_9PROT|nr:HAMP domain-containing sensor histidine kinase [Azospirillum aestuarii]MBK4722054.1 HAMP domain-containing histidine kinase [Azospirillum aestuarii]
MTWPLRPRAWPLAITVPLLVAGLMTAVGSAISSSVLARLADDQEAQLRQLAGAHLGSLAVALAPHLARQDVWETFDVLDHARQAASVASTRLLIVTLPDAFVVAASDPMAYPVGTALPPALAAHLDGADLAIDDGRGVAWSHRLIGTGDAPLGHILAEMDMAPLLAVRHEVLRTLVVTNAGLTLLLAAVGYGLVARLLRPLRILDAYVERIRSGSVEPIPARFIAEESSEFGRLFRRFNAMAAAMAEREALSARLADEEKLALLGRLASGMAHEVNNPLGGLLTAVDTLQRHGADDAVRHRSTALLERGLRGIGHVVRAALVVYKEPAGAGALSAADLDDLQFLIAHEAQRRRTRLIWDNRMPESVAVDGTAVRQMVLNLLLNACRASPPGAAVVLAATTSAMGVSITIRDEGPGLPMDMAEVLASRGTAPLPQGGRGLGLWTVGRLLDRVGGGVDIEVGPAGGTAITLTIPQAERRPRHAA